MKRTRNTEENKKIHGDFTSKRHPTAYFYKLFLSPSSQSKKLRIPNAFATTFHDELATTSFLKLSTGETRKVGLFKEGNNLYLSDGWQEFVEYYSIQYAFFLLFSYEGHSNFRVDIFDHTGCEISYPCNLHNSSELHKKTCPVEIVDDDVDNDEYDDDENDNDNDEDDDVYNEYLNVFHSSSFNPKIFDEEVIQLESDDDSSLSLHSFSVSENNFDSENKELESDEESNDTQEGPSFKKLSRLDEHKWLMKALVTAGISLPERPFFAVHIKSYMLNRGLYLNVPLPFARDYLGCTGVLDKLIKLEANDGQIFNVQCVSRPKKCTFGKGWMNFAREVGLEVGDACVLELTDAKNYVLKAHIAKRSHIKAAAPQLFSRINLFR